MKIHFDRPQPTTLACTTISEHHAGALWVSAEDVAAKLTAADCMRADRGGHATEPLEWFRPNPLGLRRGSAAAALTLQSTRRSEPPWWSSARHRQHVEDAVRGGAIEQAFLPRWRALQAAYPHNAFK